MYSWTFHHYCHKVNERMQDKLKSSDRIFTIFLLTVDMDYGETKKNLVNYSKKTHSLAEGKYLKQ